MPINKEIMSHPMYRPDIDGLRALAVLSVVAFHANWMRGGYIGVDIFFVISGFLISQIIIKNLDNQTFSLFEFYSRRVRRIFPSLVLVLSVTMIIGWLCLLSDELSQLGKHVLSGSVFISNLVLWNEAGYFDNGAMAKPLLHLWSLGVEEQFYIIWPLLLWVIFKKRLNFIRIVLFLIAISFFVNIILVQVNPVADFYSPQTRFWELMVGAVIAWLTLHNKKFSELQRNTVLANMTSAIAVVLMFIGFKFLDKHAEFPGYWALIPVTAAALLISTGQYSWFNQNILGSRVAIWFGLISFPLYLWHWPLLVFLQIINNGETPTKSIRYVIVIFSIILAWMTVRFVEQPIRFGGDKSERTNLILCGSLFSVGVVGLIFWVLDLTSSRNLQSLWIKRVGSEHAVGSSLNWYEGKDGWLFLGNNFEKTVAKLKLAQIPNSDKVAATTNEFEKIVQIGQKFHAKVFLVVGSNKSSVYAEHLPDEIKPSNIRYVNYFLDELNKINGLTVYDPTVDFLNIKNLQGPLYWKTDTHWNSKGAYFAYKGFALKAHEPIVEVSFSKGTPHFGDLLKISGIKNISLTDEDDWMPIWPAKQSWSEESREYKNDPAFGMISVIKNSKALSKKIIWVTGDSFTEGLKPYLNATFSEVHYLGHWSKKLKELPEDLSLANQKPDLILIVRVERSF